MLHNFKNWHTVLFCWTRRNAISIINGDTEDCVIELFVQVEL